MERKNFYDEIYEDLICSIQKIEDDDINERYACLYDYFLDHEDIISQYSTFDFSNERCFDKSALDCVAKRLLAKDCHALFPVFTKGNGNCLYNSISLLLTGEQSQLSTELRIKVISEMVKNRSFYDAGDFLKYGADNFEEDMLESTGDQIAAFAICMHWLMLSAVT